MSIRWKLFILLLLVTLAPILLLRLNAQQSMREVGDDLAKRTSSALVENVGDSLKRLVEDHARLLKRERQLLETTLELQSSRISQFNAGRLFLHPSAERDTDRTSVLDTGLYCNSTATGECVAFGVDDSRLVEFQGGWGRWWAGRPEKTDHPYVPIFRESFKEYGEMLMWTLYARTGKGLLLYPAPPLGVFSQEWRDDGVSGGLYGGMGMMQDGSSMMQHGMGMSRGMMRGMEGMHENMRRMWRGIQNLLPPPGKGSTKTVWHGPMQDPMTGRAVFVIVRPLLSAAGEAEGRTAFVVPVNALFHAGVHLPDISTSMQAYMVNVEGGRLRIVASTVRRQNPVHGDEAHMGWRLSGAETIYLGEADGEGVSEIAADLTDKKSGIAVQPLDGRESIWVYAPVGLSGLHLILVAPEKDVVAQAEALGDYVENRIHGQVRTTGIILIFALAAILAVSFLLSRSMTRRLKILARQARRLSEGDFDARSDVGGHDEIGELGRVLDNTGPALSEHVCIKEALNVAMEVQQALLPDGSPAFDGFEIAARCDYSDETGGDFYDFVPRSISGESTLLAVVGDVSGHGIPAALLMSSARAYLRSRAAQPGPPHAIVEHVNTQLSGDTFGTGQFVTLMLIELKAGGRELRWVRAGHEPALLFDPATGAMTELMGPGVSLGVDDDLTYETRGVDIAPGQIVVVGTDGIWEMRSPGGEMYGKERFHEAVRRHAHLDVRQMVDAIFDDLYAYLGHAPQEDDITLLIIKATDETGTNAG
ncbi:SpoIIE family protein phosphatase [Oceanidesulfovibrio marinus]|uniref:HAMP domain-containing protein n=1 Tax=Oceanidesulfovibrio marinus TaxID=370038 RepID=A0ABX6NL67_9BACT|nr:SpoIIE family protein phosphatase [Oceanidesulfovibrio marinus]QJT10370.1 HAMP domain-containing protein [Oceanidesulfovibrio marinus]